MEMLLAGSARKYAKKVLRTRSGNLVAYWPLTDPAGSATAQDLSGNGCAATINADVTLGYAGISPAGKTCAKRTGTTVSEGITIYSAALNSAFNPAEFTVAAWIKANATIWGDSTIKNFCSIRADVSNRINLSKANSAGAISYAYTAGGTAKSVTYTTASPIDWIHVAITVSKAADEMKAYFNGSQVGTTQTGLGVWAGALTSGACSLLGWASGGYFQPDGYMGHAAIWSAALDASEVASLAVPFDGGYLTFMAIGDSKTANTVNWVEWLIAGSPRIVCRPIRYAGGGWNTQEVRDGIDAALAARSDTPEIVLVNLGANDVNGGDPGATWKTNTAYIVDACRAKWPAVVVYLAKIWKRNTGLQAAGIAAINGYIDQLVAERGGWLRVGVNEALFLEGGDDGVTYTSDGTHPNAAGCALEAAAWRTVLGL